MAWDSARQLAMSIATDGTSEPNVDPADRMAIEQLARVADLHVADVTGLSTSVNGRTLTVVPRSEEHTSELQSLMRISYAVFCLKKKNRTERELHTTHQIHVRKYVRINEEVHE